VIHLAGTNAKGSTSFFIANILREQGFSVMLFTSPHIISIYERIQYNGEFIPQEEFDAIFIRHQKIIKENNLTYFETLFFIFMLYADLKKPDFLVVETGLGGRFDATNTNYIKKKYPVITHIASDHKEILGRNIYGILDEKLAIIKDNSPVFIGTCKGFIMDKILSVAVAEIITPSGEALTRALRFVPYPFNNNLALAIRVSEYICGKSITYKDYPLPPCRQERFGRIILDGAHNESGMLSLVKNFPKVSGVLLSSTKERDIKKFLRILRKCADNIILTSIPGNPRTIGKDDAYQAGCRTFSENPLSALAELENKSDGVILVTGSLYLCSFVRSVLSGQTE
jgi:dihydrofolate synthase/folylpolyglutamate synthase